MALSCRPTKEANRTCDTFESDHRAYRLFGPINGRSLEYMHVSPPPCPPNLCVWMLLQPSGAREEATTTANGERGGRRYKPMQRWKAAETEKHNAHWPLAARKEATPAPPDDHVRADQANWRQRQRFKQADRRGARRDRRPPACGRVRRPTLLERRAGPECGGRGIGAQASVREEHHRYCLPRPMRVPTLAADKEGRIREGHKLRQRMSGLQMLLVLCRGSPRTRSGTAALRRSPFRRL